MIRAFGMLLLLVIIAALHVSSVLIFIILRYLRILFFSVCFLFPLFAFADFYWERLGVAVAYTPEQLCQMMQPNASFPEIITGTYFTAADNDNYGPTYGTCWANKLNIRTGVSVPQSLGGILRRGTPPEPPTDDTDTSNPIGSDSPCSAGQVDLAPDISGNQCGPPPTCSAGFKLNDAGNLCIADGSACVATANSSCPSSTGKPQCSAGFIPDPSGGPGCVAGNGSACVATPTMGCPDTGAGTTGGTGSGTGDTGGDHDGGGDDNSTCPAGMIPGPGGCQVGTDDPADCPFGTSLSGGVCTVNSGGDGGVGTGGGGSSGTGTGTGTGSGSGSGTGSDDPCPTECAVGQSANCFANDCPSPQVDIDPLAAGPQCGLSSQRVACSAGSGSGSGSGTGTGTNTGSGSGNNSIPTDYAKDSTLSNAVSNLSGKLTDIKSSVDNLSSGKLTEIKSALDGISNAVTNKTGGSPAAWSHETRSSPALPDESVRIADLRAQIASKIASIRSDVGVMFASSMPASGYACNRGFVVFGVSYPICFDKYLDLFSYIGTGIMFIAWVIVFMVILK